jgi:hypothetical protein
LIGVEVGVPLSIVALVISFTAFWLWC